MTPYRSSTPTDQNQRRLFRDHASRRRARHLFRRRDHECDPGIPAVEPILPTSPTSTRKSSYAKLGSALRQFRFELGLKNLDSCRQRRDFGTHRDPAATESLKHSTRGVAFFVGFTAIKRHRLRRTVSSREAVLLDLVNRKLHEILRKFGSVSRTCL